MAQEIGHRSVTVEAWIRFQIGPCEMVGGQSCSRPGFYPSASVFGFQSRYTNAPYS